MNKKVLVIGSLNMDFSINLNKLPLSGETVLANDLTLVPGGKGANQAYALGKLGANVSMIGAIGNDEYGKILIENLKSVNVNTNGIKVIDGEKTGCAFVNVDKSGENNIVVVGGSNLLVDKKLIDENINLIDEADIIVMQLEIPLDVVAYVKEIALSKNKVVIIDPAPAQYNIEEILDGVDIIKPNNTELEIISGMKIYNDNDIVKAAKKMIKSGVKNVIVTLGKDGSLLVNKDKNKRFETIKVDAVDSTAAGDSFIAGLALSLSEGKDLEKAIKFGHIVSSYSVTKKGAQSSIPSKEELNLYIDKLKDGTKERIIIDCDPGTDDAIALMLAIKSNKFNIEGITTVAGNCSIDNAINNTFKILEVSGNEDIPVYRGCGKSLVKDEIDASHVHGDNGLGGLAFEKINREVESISAIDYLIDKVNSNPKEITLVACGPLTNIATIIKKEPNFCDNLKRLIIMGGGNDIGNITPYAEFNFYKDPHAAKIVFENVNCEVIVVPLNCTHKFPLNSLSENRLQYLNYHIQSDSSDQAKFIYDITRTAKKRDAYLGGAIIHDATTILYLLDNSILKVKNVDIDIIVDGDKEGMSVIKDNDSSNIKFAYDIDVDKCYKILFKEIFDIEI